MAVPDYQTLMLPTLQASGDGAEHPIQGLIEQVASTFNLSESDRKELLPSGRIPLYVNRIHWAVTYMVKAGLLSRPRRAVVQVTPEGKTVLASKPKRIDNHFLGRYPAFREFRARSGQTEDGPSGQGGDSTPEPPEETLARAWTILRRTVADGVLDRLKACTPRRFEEIVVELLVAMGYGGNYADASAVIGAPGDAGIDGVIKEDRLGLDAVYVQAKRWQATVQRQEVQSFVGSLEGRKARKGVMITTSAFTEKAKEYASMIEKRVVLVEGAQLADLMIEHKVGVSTIQQYAVDRIDEDFFTDTPTPAAS